VHAGDGWQSSDASDERKLNTRDGWQSDDALIDRRLHTGDGLRSSDGNFKHLTTSDVVQDHVRTYKVYHLYVFESVSVSHYYY
jgi:hypothetical protein